MKIELTPKGERDFIIDVDGLAFRSLFRVDMKLDPIPRLDKFIEDVAEELKQSFKIKLRKHLELKS